MDDGQGTGRLWYTSLCGTYVALDGSVFGRTATYDEVSQSPVTGDGSSARPFTLRTQVRAGERLDVTQVDSYVTGEASLRTSVTVTSLGSDEQVVLSHGGDCYIGQSDRGFSSADAVAGAPACSPLASGRFSGARMSLDPTDGGSSFAATDYGNLYEQVNAGEPFDGACSCGSALDNAMGISWAVRVPAGGSATRSWKTTVTPPTTLEYEALGDSYSSGWGLVPYLRASDPDDPNFGDGHRTNPLRCGRSTLGPAFSVSLPGAATPAADDPSARFRYRACGGAVTRNVTDSAQHPSEDGPQSSYLSASTDLVTLTIGGNDVHFSDVMLFCARNVASRADCQQLPYGRPLRSGRTPTLAQFADVAIGQLRQDALRTFRRVRAAAPNATIMVSDYPHLLSVEAPGRCAEEAAYSAGERRWLAQQVDRVNAALEADAAQAGVFFVDVSSQWSEHEKCGGGEDWSNGARVSTKRTGADDETCGTKTFRVAGHDFHQTGCFYTRSFHPNASGARAYGERYSSRLSDLLDDPPNGLTAVGLPANPAPTPAPPGGAAARADDWSPEEQADMAALDTDGASVSDLAEIQGEPDPVECGDVRQALPGQLLAVAGEGFVPGTDVTGAVVIGGREVPLDGARADSDGSVSMAFLLPPSLGDDVEAVVTLSGSSASSSTGERRLTSGLPNGTDDVACVEAERDAGLLSPDGIALPARADGGWSTTGVTTVVDTRAPTIQVLRPQEGQQVVRGTDVRPEVTCVDDVGGSGVTDCSYADRLDTSTVGPATFEVTATDRAGNRARAVVTYTVSPPPSGPPSGSSDGTGGTSPGSDPGDSTGTSSSADDGQSGASGSAGLSGDAPSSADRGVSQPAGASSPPAAGPRGLPATPAAVTVRTSTRGVVLRLRCRAGGRACSVVATLATFERRHAGVLVGLDADRGTRRLVVAAGRIVVPAGSSARLEVHFRAAARRLLRRRGALPMRLTIDQDGVPPTTRHLTARRPHRSTDA